MNNKTLLICPSVPVISAGDKYIFDIKFIEGMKAYSKFWGGPIRCLMRLDDSRSFPFGAEYKISDLSFQLDLVDSGKNISGDHLAGSDIVLASGDNFELLHMSRLCKEQEIPCVYIIEYTPETRRQITSIEYKNLLKLLKTNVWLMVQEYRRCRAFKLSSGLQANGTPSYNHYLHLNKNSMQYFDTRMKAKMYATLHELETKNSRYRKEDNIRLVYSGRLEKIKGADHLVPIAAKLRNLGVLFTLEIYGSGSLEDTILRQIKEENLSDSVFYRGTVDFETELVPTLKNSTDLFVCCHKQSDPSCTYLETLSCGVPIVGYLNKAFKGILDLADVGGGVSVDDIDGMAKLILNLDKDRKKINSLSKNALNFSKKYDFLGIFKTRIQHLNETLKPKL